MVVSGATHAVGALFFWTSYVKRIRKSVVLTFTQSVHWAMSFIFEVQLQTRDEIG